MLNTTDTPRPRDSIEVECELTDLDGYVAALRLVRGSDEASDHPPTHETMSALFAMIDCVVEQHGKLHRVFHREPELEDAENEPICVITGDAAEKLQRLARHWKCSDHDAARRAVGDATARRAGG